MVGVFLLHPSLVRVEARHVRGGQLVVEVPCEQRRMIAVLPHPASDRRLFVGFGLDVLGAILGACVEVLDRVDDLQPILVGKIHLSWFRGAVRHEAVERAVRVDSEVCLVNAAPIHAKREEGLAVHKDAAMPVDRACGPKARSDTMELMLVRGQHSAVASTQQGDAHRQASLKQVVRGYRDVGGGVAERLHLGLSEGRDIRCRRQAGLQSYVRKLHIVVLEIQGDSDNDRGGLARRDAAAIARRQQRGVHDGVCETSHLHVVEPSSACHALPHVAGHAAAVSFLWNALA